MARIITVKGTGKVSARPDFVVISMSLSSEDKNYDKAMDLASQRIQHLTETICSIGFQKSDLKTSNFNVRTVRPDYETVHDRARYSKRPVNEYMADHYVIKYVVYHALKLEFDFDAKRLTQALSAIAGCLSDPDLSIRFTVKDKTAVNEELLRSAAINAKRTAEILCESSGVKLGQLLNIDYNWGELNCYSQTLYSVQTYSDAPRSIDFEPDDINVSDTATFVWEIQ